MPLKVFCGSFQPDLEAAFIERLRARPPGLGRRLAVVTPSRKMADRLQRLICLENGLSLLNIRFHTFFSLALEIVEESGLNEKELIGDGLFHDKVMDGLLRGDAKKRLSRGLSAAYRASLRDLVDAGVEPAQFREHFGELLDDDARARLEALFGLQEKYLGRLEELSVIAPSGLARLAARRVEEGTASCLDLYAEVIYYGFYDLTGTQADFFSAVTGSGPACVFFPYKRNHPAFDFARRFFDLKLGQGGGTVSHLEREPGGALGSALDNLFKPGIQAALKDPKAFKIFNVSGARDEAWIAAKEILRLREEEKIDFQDISIVARTLEPYRVVLAQVLRENEIPFSMEAGEPLLRHPIAKLGLSLLSLRRRDFPADALMDIWESPYFKAPKGQEAATVNWKRLVSRLGVHSGWLQWVGKVSPCAKADFELYPHLVKEGRDGFVIPKEDSAALWSHVESLYARLEPAAQRAWAEHLVLAKALLEENFSVAPDEPGALSWGKTLAVLEELKVYGRIYAQASWEEFLDVFEEKMRRASLEAGPENRGVRIQDVMDARGDSCRVLFLIGLTEGLFPRQVREDPLLPDSLRARLRHPAGFWIGPKLEGYDEEKLLFYLLAASAREKLICVYPRSDEDGRARIPSVYLRELCRACGVDLDGERNVRVPRQPFAKIETLALARASPKEISLQLARHEIGAEPFLKPLGKDFRLFDDGLKRLAELRRAGEPGAMDGLIGRPEEFLKNLSKKGLSPTALDCLSACPFQFFASRVLGLAENDEPSERGEVAPWLKGTIYHQILAKFHLKLSQSGFWKKPDASWKAELQSRIDEAFREFGWKELGLYPLLWESTKRRMSFHLESFAARDIVEISESGLTPALFETDLRAEVDGRRYRGTADRIDGDGKRFRVIDYKSTWGSWKGSLDKKVLAMQAHQPPLYLEMASAARQGEPVGVFYYVLEESPELTGAKSVQEFSGAAWRAARTAIWSNIEVLAGFMERGEFLAAPDDARGGVCGYCDFHWMCRKAHPATRRRAEGSKIRAAFDAAHEVKIG